MNRPLREPSANAVHASPTVNSPHTSPLKSLAIALVAALFMTFVGAVGTGQVPVGSRLMYWLVLMFTGALIGLGISSGIHQWGALRSRPVVEGALISMLIALPLSVVVVMANIFFLGAGKPGLIEFAVVALVVLVVSVLLTTINYAMARPSAGVAGELSLIVSVEKANAAEPPALLSRLPPHMRHARLLALQAEDHYLRVHTDAGNALILLRMSDAVSELAGIEGRRVHRSWWVAREAIVDAPSEKGRTTLRLIGDIDVPVNRTSRPELIRDGWLP